MKRLIMLMILVVMFMSQFVYGAANEDGPLTLMKDPKQSTQNSGGPPLPQMSPQQQGQGQDLEFYDIYGVVPTKASIPYLYIILGTLLIIVAGALLYWWLKKRGKRIFTPIIPAWERAMTDLNAAKSLQNQEQGRAYMDRASQILRHYIEQRFAIKSTRQTTAEFLYSLGGKNSSELTNYRPELQDCLEQADMAKFAHKQQNEQNLVVMEEAVTTFVHSTRPADSGKEAGK
ncbi:MAG: hypothetical protein ACI8PB_002627 [Desulforhopalus sp.]|jgi:hypothetical protein